MKAEYFAARPYVDTSGHIPALVADESSWVAVIADDGAPAWWAEVHCDPRRHYDIGDRRQYTDDSPPEGCETWAEWPPLLEAVADCTDAVRSNALDAWGDYLYDNGMRAWRVYPRGFANEFDLILTPAGAELLDGEACEVDLRDAAKLIAEGHDWHGEIVWPTATA